MITERREIALKNENENTRKVKAKNTSHLFLMWLPNIFNPHKLIANIRHPINEVFHTKHNQYPVGDSFHIVEHVLFNRVVTVDVVEKSEFPRGLANRTRQLFKRDFYYGHDQYFPEPFKLVNRTFIKKGVVFDRQEHASQFKDRSQIKP